MVSGSLALLYFLLSFHGGRQGSGPDRGRSPVEWGEFPFVCLFVRSPLWVIQPGLSPSKAWLDGPEGGDKRTYKRTYEWTYERMYERTYKRMENLPILQDFVPYQGRCPAFPHQNPRESRAGQGNR